MMAVATGIVAAVLSLLIDRRPMGHSWPPREDGAPASAQHRACRPFEHLWTRKPELTEKMSTSLSD